MPINESYQFLEKFAGFEDKYVLIGGTATSIVLAESELESRRTKDYDMVILEDKKDQEFYLALTSFFEEGEYTPLLLDEGGKLYRFTTRKEAYPKVIELFAVKPFWIAEEARTSPIHFEENMSLSALLLDNDYYELLSKGKIILQGYSVLSNSYLIILKAKAWLDLSQKKESGKYHVDSRDIKKHLNDIARLAGSLEGNEKVTLPVSVQKDMREFLEVIKEKVELIPQNKDIVLERNQIIDSLEKLLGND